MTRVPAQVRSHTCEDVALSSAMLEEDHRGGMCRFVRMAYLAVVASHTVNGVAAIHSDIIKHTIFSEFHELWPEKFQNKTNGVTPRRWLAMCNPPMQRLLSDTLGSNAWINDLSMLQAPRRPPPPPLPSLPRAPCSLIPCRAYASCKGEGACSWTVVRRPVCRQFLVLTLLPLAHLGSCPPCI